MIFVTVGTHEQPFNRLIQAVDELKASSTISADETVFVQTGFSTYEPRYCEWARLLTYEDMQRYMREARIVITHGGPASFLAPLQLGKVPIVMPRRAKYGEHVNDHQIQFVNDVSKRFGNIIVVEDRDELATAIIGYRQIWMDMNNRKSKSNNQKFCNQFKEIVNQLLN